MIHWSGCWEDRGDRKICRYMIAWDVQGPLISGCLGGYSGGGSFQLEKFIKEKDFYVEYNFDFQKKFDEKTISQAEACQDFIYSYHDVEAWFDSENLVLDEACLAELCRSGDLFFGGVEVPRSLKSLFPMLGLITTPRRKED